MKKLSNIYDARIADQRPAGLEDELRAVLMRKGKCWGYITLLRCSGEPLFQPEERDLLAAAAPVIGNALRQFRLALPNGTTQRITRHRNSDHVPYTWNRLTQSNSPEMAYRPASMGENRLGNTPKTHSGRLHKRTGELNG
ncbi:hypothetical protein ACSSTO_11745 [Bacillus atrophaeus]|uniref:hypothetical protein n=1 Tax=Bacillus atrophaeus TaxID=1452 RepID=UPI003EDAB6E3